ncbi:MAG TPA: hypothetical protein VMN03_08105 [Burkholderiales bacterium]|nr:hypothetical protein [Burkholderiales bacterium]
MKRPGIVQPAWQHDSPERADVVARLDALRIGARRAGIAIGEHITVVKSRRGDPSRTRLVIGLDEPLAHDVSVRGNELLITLEPLPTGSIYDGLQF